MQLKCQICEKHFCCIVHRIDHENKNHLKPTLPVVKQPLTVQLYQQKSSVINTPQIQILVTKSFKSKIDTNKSVLDEILYRTLLNNKFGIVSSSLIYLQNISLQYCKQMAKFIEMPLQAHIDANNTQAVGKKIKNNSASISCDDGCQSASNACLSSTTDKIKLKSDVQSAATAEIQCNVRKRIYNSFFRSDSVVKNSFFSSENKKRRILLAVRRKKCKSKLDTSVNIVLIKNEEIHNYSSAISEQFAASSNLTSPPIESGSGVKASTPIMSDFEGLELSQNDNKLNTGANNVGINNKRIENYSPAVSEIFTTSDNLISPVNENDSSNSLKASTPIMSESEGLELSQNVDNKLCDLSNDSVLSFYQTPFGNNIDFSAEQLTLSRNKGLAVVTPLRGIIIKTPKFKAHGNDTPSNESPKIRKVTFFDNSSINSKPLESVKEVDFEEDSILQGTEEFVVRRCSVGTSNEMICPERKGLFNTVADIVSSAIQGFPSLVKSSWEWGQEVHEIPKPSSGSKRLLTPDKQPDLLSRSPVPKRLCYRKNLVVSPIRGRRALGTNQSRNIS